MTKKLLAIALTLAMVLTFASFPAFADEPAVITGITADVRFVKNDGTPVGANGANTADKMVDGQTTATYYQSAESVWNSSKITVTFDLGDTYVLSTMDYYGGTLYINNGTVYATNAGLDAAGSEWTEIGGFTSDDEGYPEYLTATATFSDTTAYRYVKVVANSYSATGSKIALREFVFKGVLGTASEGGEGGDSGVSSTPVEITGVTATSNHSANGSYTTNKMLDGDRKNTYFQTSTSFSDLANPDFEIIFDLGNTYNITHFSYYGTTKYMKAANIYASNSNDANAEWTLIASFTGASMSWATETIYRVAEFDVSHEDFYQYIKMEAVELNSAGQQGIREITFTGIQGTPGAVIVPTTYTVNYVDAEGNPVADAKEVDGIVGGVVTENAVEVEGYTANEATKTITLIDGTNEITFTYTKKAETTYTVKYVDANGNPVADTKTADGYVGDTVQENAVAVYGYKVSGETAKSITLVDGTNEIVFTYVVFETMTDTPDSLLFNATIESYSGLDPAYPATNILDGNSATVASTGWTSYPKMNIVIDLGDNYDLDNIVLDWVTNTGTGMNWGVAGGSHRATKYTISFSEDGTNFTTAYEYDDTTSLAAKDTLTVADFLVNPANVRYIKIYADRTFSAGRTALRDIYVNGYVAADRVLSAPDISLYAEGSTAIDFPITVMTVDNVDPLTYFDAANWVLDNCELEVTVEDVSDPASVYYTWDINVKAKPIDGTQPFSMDLDLPDSYIFTDAFSYYLEPSDLLFDSAIAAGQNAITLSKNSIVLNYKEDGTLTDASAKVEARTINMVIEIQSVMEDKLPYEGYDEVVIELKEFKAKGERVRYYLDEFVKVDNKYYASLLVTKAGVEQLEVTIGIYGVKENGTKVELDTRTITSDLINIEAKYPAPQTEAQKVKDYTFPMDVLDQLVDTVHPADLPTYTDDEWAYFKEILIARGWTADNAETEITRVRTLVEDAKAVLDDPDWVPTKDYAEGTLYLINRRVKVNTTGDNLTYETVIRLGTTVWNMLVDMHFDSFSIRGTVARPSAQYSEGLENDIDDVYLTFRRDIDFTGYEKFTEGNGFCMRVRLIASTDDYSKVALGKAYNAVRRALGDDQVSPVLLRYDWYNWAKNPFESGVITVRLTENWVENYGMFNLATYHMSGYKYAEDNDPELTLLEDKIAIANPLTREVSIEFEGAAKLYDAYVIVGTEKIPSDEPEVNGTYYDVD